MNARIFCNGKAPFQRLHRIRSDRPWHNRNSPKPEDCRTNVRISCNSNPWPSPWFELSFQKPVFGKLFPEKFPAGKPVEIVRSGSLVPPRTRRMIHIENMSIIIPEFSSAKFRKVLFRANDCLFRRKAHDIRRKSRQHAHARKVFRGHLPVEFRADFTKRFPVFRRTQEVVAKSDFFRGIFRPAKCAKLPENRLGKTPGLEIGKGPPREAVPVKRHRFGHLGGAVIPALDIPVERFSFRRVMALADNQKLPVRSRFVTLPHERL